mgnify:CR=1 FL=1
MSRFSPQIPPTPKQTNQVALKDYKTYLDYYSSKKLIPKNVTFIVFRLLIIKH